MAAGARVRIEIEVAGEGFVPLIDGPVVSAKPRLEREPGQSVLTLQVQDDSVLLNRHDETFSFDDIPAREIVEKLFDSADEIATLNIDEDLESGTESSAIRGNQTAMQLLRCLARAYGKHAYVLPGENAGESIGCFKSLPSSNDGQSDELPPLVLVGAEANCASLDTSRDYMRPQETYASTIRLSDKQQVDESSSFRDQTPLGSRHALPEGIRPARRRLRPQPCVGINLSRAASAHAQQSAFAFETRGRVLEGCYRGVLRPYQLVEVQAGETAQSGVWMVHQVTHTLSRSSYGQSFTLHRDAESEKQSGHDTQADPTKGIF
jgi:hypothetical protein